MSCYRRAVNQMKVMAVDYGDARTGIAISDILGMLAGETLVIKAWNQDKVAQEITELAKSRNVERIVLGHPLNMDGSLGPRAEKSEALAEALRISTGLEVALWDERRTTIDAHRILSENDRHGKKRKETIDAVAASLILDSYLGFLRNTQK